ncbi:MAG: glycosyltransferase [Aeromicrobium sp.]
MTRTHLVVVRAREGGSRPGPSVVDATSRSLAAQTHPDWTFVTGPTVGAADDGADCAGLLLLPRDVPVPDDADDVLVVVLPEGGTLVPDALERIARAANRGARLISWDSDVDGTPALRFGWSPETLWSADYLHGCFAMTLDDYRRAAAAAAGGGLPLCTWSLLLHVEPDLSPTVHVPHSLTRRADTAPVSVATAEAVVQAGLDHRGVPATIDRSDGTSRLTWHPDAWPTVSIVIPSRHNEALLDPLLHSLALSARLDGGPAFDVLVVDNGERTADSEAFYERHRAAGHGYPLEVLWWEETPFHYGHVNNEGVRRSGGDVVVLLNDDTLVERAGWLAELVGLATLPGIGCAGTALLDPAGRLQHAGVWLGMWGYAGHLFAGLEPGSDTLMGSTTWYRNTLAVTAACLAIRKDVFQAVGGLDPRLVLAGSDVTLGLDLHASGLRNVCSPHPDVHHLESATRSSAPLGDQLASMVRYQPWHDVGDPYLNDRVSLRSKTPKLRRKNERDPIAVVRDELGVIL